MNVRVDYTGIHHLVDETRRLLCGDEASFDWRESATREEVTCSACVRLLADDARRAAPRTHDSED